MEICETWVLAEERSTSLGELNSEVGRLVNALNARPLARRGGSRDDAFSGEERASLHPLPEDPFERYERRAVGIVSEDMRLVASVPDAHPGEAQGYVHGADCYRRKRDSADCQRRPLRPARQVAHRGFRPHASRDPPR